MNYTDRRLFLFMLHQARRLRFDLKYTWELRRAYLLGMKCVFIFMDEDFRIADNMRDVWKNQCAGHTMGRD